MSRATPELLGDLRGEMMAQATGSEGERMRQGRGASRGAQDRPAAPLGRRHRSRQLRRAHLVGVGGIGMSALARHLRHRDWRISGSDENLGESTAGFAELGIDLAQGHAASHLPVACDLVVRTAAVGDDNPELVEARVRKLEVKSYGAMLGELVADRDSIAVAGTHGKTTTGAILAFLLERAGLAPGAVIGGLVPQIGGNALTGDGAPFVVEACEYRETFLEFRTRHAIITNVDADHLDWYGTQDRLRAAFRRFAAGIDREGAIVTTSEVAHALDLRGPGRSRVITIGARKSDVRMEDDEGGFRLVHPDGTRSPRLEIGMSGQHNRLDAAFAAVAAHRLYGLSYAAIAEHLPEFAGIARRFELRLESESAVVIDDYAHHPTEVEAAILAARERFPDRRLVALFQPHLEARTRQHFPGFLNALVLADRAILVRDYHVRGRDSGGFDGARRIAETMRRLGVREAHYCASLAEASEDLAKGHRAGDVVLVMGAGDVGETSRALARRLR
jgi:UDP-N-acetylmuramate--alanine ligase